MKIAICDDNKIIVEQLFELIKKHDEKSQINCFFKPSQLFDYMQTDTVDLIFMDLEFCEENEDGIKWLKEIKKIFKNTIVIILTAYEERYKEGYEVRAFRFMTKPINENELFGYLVACENELKMSGSILVARRGITYSINMYDICYISAQAGGSEIWTRKDMFLSEESLLRWESNLPMENFFRCHSKYIVNLYHVKKIENQKLTLLNGEIIPVSRRKWKEFQIAYMKYDTKI